MDYFSAACALCFTRSDRPQRARAKPTQKAREDGDRDGRGHMGRPRCVLSWSAALHVFKQWKTCLCSYPCEVRQPTAVICSAPPPVWFPYPPTTLSASMRGFSALPQGDHFAGGPFVESPQGTWISPPGVYVLFDFPPGGVCTIRKNEKIPTPLSPDLPSSVRSWDGLRNRPFLVSEDLAPPGPRLPHACAFSLPSRPLLSNACCA